MLIAQLKDRHRWLLPALGLVSVCTYVLLGAYRVPDGWVALDARDPETYINPGWRWTWPGSRPPLAPRQPLRQVVDVALSGNPSITVRLQGSFYVPVGAESAWLAANGATGFEPGLRTLVRTALRASRTEVTARSVLEGRLKSDLLAHAKQSLRAAGLEWSDLSIDLPRSGNSEVFERIQKLLTSGRTQNERKVVVVGWDGADWQLIRPLLASGRMPNLQRLIELGVAAELRSEEPMLSPILWTTLATGKSPTEHGITDFVTRDAATGRPVPITSQSRRVRAVWNIASAAGLEVDVVGWWATWPSEAVRGTIISDRVAPQLFGSSFDQDDEGLVYPAERWSPLRRKLTKPAAVTCNEVRRFVDVACEEIDKKWTAYPAERRVVDPVNHLRKIIATTRSYHAMALALLERQSDLTMLYYEGSDTVAHLFARYLPPQLPGVDSLEISRFGKAVPRFYVYLDELLGEVLARVDLAETTLLLVSDHGFHSGEARPGIGSREPFGASASHWHRLFGVLAAAGSGVVPLTVDTASLYDIAPTVLDLLGLPVPGDLAGKALFQTDSPGPPELASLDGLPPAEVVAAPASGAALEQRLRELAALGYISTPTDHANSTHSSKLQSRRLPAKATVKGAREAYNLGAIYIRRGELGAARTELQEAVRIDQAFGPAYLALADVERRLGAPDEAFEILRTGLARSERIPAASLSMLVDLAAKAGRLAEAGEVLASLHGRVGDTAPYHSALGLARERYGRLDAAHESYKRALEIDPLDSLALANEIGVLQHLERASEARQVFEHALQVSERDLSSLNHLGVIALENRWLADAERLFRKVLESDPGNPGVLSNLASTLLHGNKTQEALELLTRAVERDPTNSQNRFNLGAAYARLGNTKLALRQFEEAEGLGLREARLFLAQSALLSQAGRASEARAKLATAQRIDPDHPGISALRVRLSGGR